MDIDLVVDATNIDDVELSTNAFETMIGDDWIVESEVVFITSQPTQYPTAVPSNVPSTFIPSTKPSRTGLVVTFDVNIFNLNIFISMY